MLTEEAVLALAQLPSPLLTAYLDTSKRTLAISLPTPPYLAWLKGEAKRLAESVPAAEQKSFWQQVSRVEAVLAEPPAQNGLVVFAGPTTWTLIPVNSAIPNSLHWGQPAVSPLVGLVGKYGPCCVVVVDRARARFFRYWLGEMAELEELKFESHKSAWKRKDLGHVDVPRIKKTWGSQRDSFEHRLEAEYHRWHRRLGERTREWSAKEGMTRIFLVGSQRQTGEIKRVLPWSFRDNATLIAEDLAGMRPVTIKRHLEPKIQARAAQEANRDVTELVYGTAGAVVGLDATLFQLQAGKISELLLAEGFDSDLRQCTKCGLAARSGDPVCISCGSGRKSVRLSEILPGLASAHRTKIEIVDGSAGEQLVNAGGIGGWLRQNKLAAAR